MAAAKDGSTRRSWSLEERQRKNYLFAGSDGGERRAAIMYTLIETGRFDDVDPEAWLADIIARIADHPISRPDELLAPLEMGKSRAPRHRRIAMRGHQITLTPDHGAAAQRRLDGEPQARRADLAEGGTRQDCQSARKTDPLSASNIDPSVARVVTEGGRSPTGVTTRAAS